MQVPENSIRIEIEVDVNQHQAGWFRARECLIHCTSEKAVQFLRLSKKLNEELSVPTNDHFQPKEKEFVAVYDPGVKGWMRGYIVYIQKDESCPKINIYLIDYGYSKCYDSLKNLRPLPKWFSTSVLETQSFKVALYGVEPIESVISLTGPAQKKIANRWTQASVKMMIQKLKSSDSVYFVQKLKFEEISLGYIYVQRGDDLCSLHEQLIKDGLAVPYEEYICNVFTERIYVIVASIRQQREFDNEASVRKKLYPSLPPDPPPFKHPYAEIKRSNSLVSCTSNDSSTSTQFQSCYNSSSSSNSGLTDFSEEEDGFSQSYTSPSFDSFSSSSTPLHTHTKKETLACNSSTSCYNTPENSCEKQQPQYPSRDSIPLSLRDHPVNPLSTEYFKDCKIHFTRLNKGKRSSRNNSSVNDIKVPARKSQHGIECETANLDSDNFVTGTFDLLNVYQRAENINGGSAGTLETNVGMESLSPDNVKDKILVLINDVDAFYPISHLKNSSLDAATLENFLPPFITPPNQCLVRTQFKCMRVIMSVMKLQNLDRLRIRDITICQKFIIPAMLTKKNLVIVNTAGSGKTTGYLISLVSLLRASKPNAEPGVSPRSLIITPYSAKCEKIRNACCGIINGKSHVPEDSEEHDLRVNFAYGCSKKLEKEKLIELTVGYDVLVCTPKMLLRLLSKSTFDLNRLEIVVFDDYHVLHKHYRTEVHDIIDCVRLLKKRCVQKVIVSNQWLPTLKTTLRESLITSETILLISCCLEASRFVRSHHKLELLSEKNIDKKIIDLVTRETERKTVVILFSDEDIIHLMYSELKVGGRPVYSIRGSTYRDQDLVNEFKADVKSGKHPILLCNDFVVRRFHIYQADILIHHSLPNTRTDFNIRFSVLLDRLQHVANEMYLQNPKKSQSEFQKPQSFIYVNENNRRQFPQLLDIMKDLGAEIPDHVNAVIKNMLRQKEFVKKKDFCSNIKELGKCANRRHCEYRHMLFKDLDSPDPSLPQNGFVQLLITHVYSPTHYRVRLLSHTKEDGTVVPISTPNLPLKLKSYFSKNDPEPFDCREVEVIAAIDTSGFGDSYVRVKVMKFVDFMSRRELDGTEIMEPKTALLKYIDTGEEYVKPLTALIALPSELVTIPEATVDVFICNLVPIDDDITWGEILKKLTIAKISEARKVDGIKFIGKVQLVLGRSIWLSSFDTYTYHKYLKKDVLESFSIFRFLLNDKLAIRNENHLKTLLELCKEFNLDSCGETGGKSQSSRSVINDLLSSELDCCQSSLKFKEESDESSSTESTSGKISKFIEKEKDKPNMDPRKLMVRQMRKLLRMSDPEAQQETSNNKAELDNSNGSYSSLNPSIQGKDSESNSKEIFSDKNTIAQKHALTFRKLIASADKSGKEDSTGIILEEISSIRKEWLERPVPVGASVLKPSVEWRQDLNNVYLVFHVNSDKYEFLYDWKNFCFEAEMEGKFYKVDACLFALIDVTKVRHNKSGVEIRATLPKLTKDENWRRLLEDPKELPRLKMMQQNLIDSDDDTQDDDDNYHLYLPEFERKNLPNSMADGLEDFYKNPDEYESDRSSNDYADEEAKVED